MFLVKKILAKHWLEYLLELLQETAGNPQNLDNSVFKTTVMSSFKTPYIFTVFSF